MKVPHDLQVQLLDLQRIDTEKTRLERRKRLSPAAGRVEELESDAARMRSELLALRTDSEDLARAISRTDQDLDRVKERSRRDEELLGSGVGAKMQSELAHEVQSLRRRLSDLEDAELEMLEKQDALSAAMERTQAALAKTGEQMAAAGEQLAEETRDAQLQTRELQAERAAVAAALPAEVLGVFERSRNAMGVAAARFADNQCGGCRLSIPPAEAAQLMSAPLDELEFCDECGCILVRGG